MSSSSESTIPSSSGGEGLLTPSLLHQHNEIGDSDSSSSGSGSSGYVQVSLTVFNVLTEKAGAVAGAFNQELQRSVFPLLRTVVRDWQSGIQSEWEVYQSRGNSTARFICTVLIVFAIAFHVELYHLGKYLFQKGGLFQQWNLSLTLYFQRVKRHRRRSRRIRQSKKLSMFGKGGSLHAQDPRVMTSSSLQNKLSSPTSTASTVEDSGLHSSRPLSPMPPPTSRRLSMTQVYNNKGSKQLQVMSDGSNSNSSIPRLRGMHRTDSRGRSRSPLRSASLGHGPAARATLSSQSASAYHQQRSRSPMRSVSMGHGPNARSNASISPTRRRQSHSATPYTPNFSRNTAHANLLRNASIGHSSTRSNFSMSSGSQVTNNSARFLQDSNASFDVLATNGSNLGFSSSGSRTGGGGSSSLLLGLTQQPQNTSTSTIASKDDTRATTPSNSVTSSFSYATPKDIVNNHSGEMPTSPSTSNNNSNAMATNQRVSRRLKRRSVHTTTAPSKGPEMAPLSASTHIRRSQTTESAALAMSKQRFKKHPNVPQPQSQQRRRMSLSNDSATGGASAKSGQFSLADERLLSRLGAVGAGPPKRNQSSGNMSGSRRNHHHSKQHPHQHNSSNSSLNASDRQHTGAAGSFARTQRARSGTGASASPMARHYRQPQQQQQQHQQSRSMPNTPVQSSRSRGHSPVPTRTPTTSYKHQGLNRELSRQELGYE